MLRNGCLDLTCCLYFVVGAGGTVEVLLGCSNVLALGVTWDDRLPVCQWSGVQCVTPRELNQIESTLSSQGEPIERRNAALSSARAVLEVDQQAQLVIAALNFSSPLSSCAGKLGTLNHNLSEHNPALPHARIY